jgi:predicted MFS family arabinose efflux permease
VTAAGFTAFGPMPTFFLSALAVLVRQDLGFTVDRLGLSVAVFFLFAAIGSATFGPLVERLGGRRSLRTALAGSAVALGLLATTRTWWQLTVVLAFAGLAHALLQIGANLLLARDVPSDRKGVAFGIKQSSVPITTMLAGVAVPTLGLTLGWRWTYVAAAVLAVLVLMGQARGDRGRPSPPRRQDPAISVRAFDRRELVVLAAAGGLAAGPANGVGTFLVEYAVAIGIGVGRAGTLLATVSAIGLVARVTVGHLYDVRPDVDLGLVAMLMLVGCAAFLAFPLAQDGPDRLWLLATLAFAGGWGWPGLYTVIVASRNAHAPAGATGIAQTGIFAGAVIGPLVLGQTIARVSYAAAWTLAALSQCAGAALVLAVSRARRRRLAAAA